MDLLQPQIINLVQRKESRRLQAIINPKGALSVLLLVHSGSWRCWSKLATACVTVPWWCSALLVLCGFDHDGFLSRRTVDLHVLLVQKAHLTNQWLWSRWSCSSAARPFVLRWHSRLELKILFPQIASKYLLILRRKVQENMVLLS
jgi:hypothetical protein